MTRYLLDTNIWIYLMRNRPSEVRARYSRLKPGAVLLSPIVLGELNVGWRKSAQREANQVLLESYLQGAVVDPIDSNVAAAYGDIRAELETNGTPGDPVSLDIGAQPRAHDALTPQTSHVGRLLSASPRGQQQ